MSSVPSAVPTQRDDDVQSRQVTRSSSATHSASCTWRQHAPGPYAENISQWIHAEGVKGGGYWGGVSPAQPTRRSEGASWAPPAGSGAEPRPQTTFQHFLGVTECFRWKENAILLLNVVTILTTATAEICWNSVENFWGEHFGGLSRKHPLNTALAHPSPCHFLPRPPRLVRPSARRWLNNYSTLRFDCSSTALRPSYVTALLVWAAALRPK